MNPSISFENFLSLFWLGILIVPNFKVESHNVPFADESFRRLESGENSEEIVNQCCRREAKFVTIGYSLDDTELRVDVGQCRQACEKPQIKPLRREEFDKYLKKYPNMDPMQIFLALQTRVTNPQGSSVDAEDAEISQSQVTTMSTSSSSSSHSCLSSTCHPVSYRRERHFGIAGHEEEIDVIESCDCVKMPQECQRLSRPVRVHVDTPYEKVVDMGQCMGNCDDTSDHSSDLTCRSVRNRTVTIDGPNGAQCLEVIDECQCTGNCYRVREFFKVYDYSNVFRALEERIVRNSSHSDAEGTNETIGNEIGILSQESGIPLPISESVAIEPLTKVIDIGRCGGGCSDGHVTSKCLAWSSGNGTCISSLYGGRSKCSPTKFVTHSYADKKGHRHNVVSVIHCGCR